MTACKLQADLQVLEPLKLRVKKGQSQLAPGPYNAKLDTKTKKGQTTLHVVVDLGGKKKNNPQLEIPLLPGQSLPTRHGELHVPAAQSGQAFDLSVWVDSDVFETPEAWTTEYCTREGRITECIRDQNYQRYCVTRTVTYEGRRDVRYFERITRTDYDIRLFAVGTEHEVAVARAHTSDQTRIVTYRDLCDVHQDLDIIIRSDQIVPRNIEMRTMDPRAERRPGSVLLE